jgi:hypothetical protein
MEINSFPLGATLFGINNEPGVLGKNYTIGNQPGVVGTYLLIQLISNTSSGILSPAEIQVKAGNIALVTPIHSF